MHKKSLYRFAFLALTLTLVSCGPTSNVSQSKNDAVATHATAPQPNAVGVSSGKPVPPLKIAVPESPPTALGLYQFKKMDADELLTLANKAASQKVYMVAAASQYWYVETTKNGQYNLACYLARQNQIDAALYWLQLAAIDEGVDVEMAQSDEDLGALRKDPRWGQVLQYIQACNKHFETAQLSRTILILPENYQKPTPLVAVVWLHGYGSRPEDFVNDGIQEYVNELNIALIGVSGTRATGPRSFVWAEDVEKDALRIRGAIKEVSDRVTIEPGRVITLGFSQGAQVGLEVAVRYPEEFAGSVVLSPGAEPQLNSLKPSPLLASRGYVLSCGGQERPGNVLLTASDADWLRRAEAKIIHEPYPGVSAHALPQDFYERFPEWLTFILKAEKE